MQIDQTFTVAAPPAAVWAAFHDPELLVACLPGASLRAPAEDGRLPLLFKVKLGPIAAAFQGEGTVTLDEASRTGSFAGHAADTRSNSRVKGEAAFRLSEDLAGGTQVGVAVTFTITGSLAQFSREGIVRALAEQLTRQFADNLQAELDAMPETPTAASGAAAASAALVGTPASRVAGPAAAHPADSVDAALASAAPAVGTASAALSAAPEASTSAATGASPVASTSASTCAAPEGRASAGASAEPAVRAPAARPDMTTLDTETAQAMCLASAAGGGAMPWAVDTPAVEAPRPPRPPRPRAARRDEAPAINGFALLGAVIKSYWYKLIGRKTS